MSFGSLAWSEPIPGRAIPLRSTGNRRPRARWTTLDWATSFTVSAFWHLLVLAVLVQTVHPFELPDVNRAIDVELLPPPSEVEVDLRPRQQDEPPPKPAQVRPQAPVLPRAVEVKPQPKPQPRQLLDVARPSQLELQNPVEAPRRVVPAPRLQTQQATPQVPEAPPEPVTVARPAPILRPSPEAAPAPAGRAPPLDASRAAPQIPEAAAPAESAAPPVLTNQTVILQAPVEIRPREPAPAGRRLTTEGAAPDIPAASGGAAGGGASANARSALEGLQGGLGPGGLKGLRTTVGCEDPDAYRLTAEERAACRQRFAEGRGAPDLGLNIPARKQAEFDRAAACKASTIAKGIPNEGSPTPGSSIPGLGVTPSLKVCGPGER